MSITEEQLREYEENGFLFLQNYFSQDEVERWNALQDSKVNRNG